MFCRITFHTPCDKIRQSLRMAYICKIKILYHFRTIRGTFIIFIACNIISPYTAPVSVNTGFMIFRFFQCLCVIFIFFCRNFQQFILGQSGNLRYKVYFITGTNFFQIKHGFRHMRFQIIGSVHIEHNGPFLSLAVLTFIGFQRIGKIYKCFIYIYLPQIRRHNNIILTKRFSTDGDSIFLRRIFFLYFSR